MKGELSINRPSNDEDGHKMVVKVRANGVARFVTIETTAENFLLAVTGRAAIPCEVVVRTKAVPSRGMKGVGRFIAIEGLDGAGTTTQSKLLQQWMAERGEVLLTREPTDGSIGRIIRKVLSKAEGAPHWHALPWLFAADRADHLFSEVQPALEAGTNVITDRYYHSSLAYQSLTLPIEKVAALNDFRAPDLTIFIELSTEACLARIEARGEALEIFEKKEHLEAISTAYDRVIAYLRARGERIVIIDGNRPIEAVFRDVCDTVREHGSTRPY